MNFLDFCKAVQSDNTQTIAASNSLVLNYTNSTGKTFPLDASEAILFLGFLDSSYEKCHEAWDTTETKEENYTQYEEKSYRSIFELCRKREELNKICTLAGSQTKPLIMVLSKLICYLGGFNYEGVDTNTRFDRDSVRTALRNVPKVLEDLAKSQSKTDSAPEVRNYERVYRIWLHEKGNQETTIKRYTDDVSKYIDKLIKAEGSQFLNLFTIGTVQRLGELMQWLESTTDWTEVDARGNGMYRAALKKYKAFLLTLTNCAMLPKPFILLAGISGTGKTRFVRQQAASARPNLSNYQLIPVRPDWHEPSDLLGYVTRIGEERYVPTPFLKFVIAAWLDAFDKIEGDKILLRPLDDITTFWCCLDEMNLAPVEQYFADYLAVLETRQWSGDAYTCDALVHPARLLEKETSLPALQKSLGLGGKDDLWNHFLKHGIPLPPNLIVAGTVNMDETTHGFSRKVIDRAFTIDFGEFFPNKVDEFFAPAKTPKTLKFPRYARASKADFASVLADPDGAESIKFFGAVNEPLIGTPFELAFRALNELLLAVKCFAPADAENLEAVWDDFLMTKLLPRIEGDAEKLRAFGEQSLLTRLHSKVEQQLTKTKVGKIRPDLLQTLNSGEAFSVEARSLKKINWMQERLTSNAFTSFWP